MAVLNFRVIVKLPCTVFCVLHLCRVRKLLLNHKLCDLLINSEAFVALNNAFHHFFAFR